MSNEELVMKIKEGDSVQSHLQLLYDKNKPLIKKMIAPYTRFECEQDLLQESFFGLYNAVTKFDADYNTKFMTYAKFWILEAVKRYILNYGSLIALPARANERIVNYNKIISMYLMNYGRKPTVKEIAEHMNLTIREVFDIEKVNIGVISLDTPIINSDTEINLSDTLESNVDVESDVLDKVCKQQLEDELWPVVGSYLENEEYLILKDLFRYNHSLKYVAEKYNLSYYKVRDIKEAALRKLRKGKTRKKLLEKYEIANANLLYHGSYSSFAHHNGSNVEQLALKNVELMHS